MNEIKHVIDEQGDSEPDFQLVKGAPILDGAKAETKNNERAQKAAAYQQKGTTDSSPAEQSEKDEESHPLLPISNRSK